MSYEGRTEYLCVDGHYTIEDANIYPEHSATKCSCGKAFAYIHDINDTNGYDEENPHPTTVCAPKTEIGYDDIWFRDHYGTNYALKNLKYTPGEHWELISDREKRFKEAMNAHEKERLEFIANKLKD